MLHLRVIYLNLFAVLVDFEYFGFLNMPLISLLFRSLIIRIMQRSKLFLGASGIFCPCDCVLI